METVPYYPITIVSGDTFELPFNWKIQNCSDGTLTAVDLSDVSSVEAKLLDKNNAEVVDFTASVTNASGGEVTLSLTDTQTGALSGAILDKPVESYGRYYTRLIWNSGKKETILRGKVSLVNVEGV